MRLYGETIPGWMELGHFAAVAHQIESLAIILVEDDARQDVRRAARLFGAADALRATSMAAMTAQEHEEFGRAVATIRDKLDDTAFATAWTEGRAMTLAQAIAYAAVSTEVTSASSSQRA
jgi:hypothetical protein